MIEIEGNVALQDYSRQAERYSGACLTNCNSSLDISPMDVVKLAGFAADALLLHGQIRGAIKENDHLPDVVRNDLPSLRSILWMIMIRGAISQDLVRYSGTKAPQGSLESYPYTLFALTRCWLNGMDDVMDQSGPPITKKTFMSNEKQNTITSALAKEFLRLYRRKPEQKNQLRETVKQYRMVRDYWLDCFNRNENDTLSLSFESALKYNIEAMGPITYILTRTLSVDYNLKPQFENELNQTLTYYAAAGKLIDDMTDWLKDYRKDELNLFHLALAESGEQEMVINRVSWLKVLGKRVFVPITLFKIFAPKATKRYFEQIDTFISHLEKTRFFQLTMSMKGVRQMMWAYAINEGLPQV